MTITQPKPRLLDRAVLSGAQRAELNHSARERLGDDKRSLADRGSYCIRPAAPMPRAYGWWILAKLNQVATHFGGEPVTAAECSMTRYRPGEGFREHTDYDHSPRFRARRFSFIVLLSEPGTDFTGGQLMVDREHVPLGAGDLVGFTAITPHEVKPVMTGLRLVVVGFGHRPGSKRPYGVDAGAWFVT